MYVDEGIIILTRGLRVIFIKKEIFYVSISQSIQRLTKARVDLEGRLMQLYHCDGG